MSKFTKEDDITDSQQRLRNLAKKLREQTNRKQRAEEFFGYQKVSDSYQMMEDMKNQKGSHNFDKNQSNSTDLVEDFKKESSNNKPIAANFSNKYNDHQHNNAYRANNGACKL